MSNKLDIDDCHQLLQEIMWQFSDEKDEGYDEAFLATSELQRELKIYQLLGGDFNKIKNSIVDLHDNYHTIADDQVIDSSTYCSSVQPKIIIF